MFLLRDRVSLKLLKKENPLLIGENDADSLRQIALKNTHTLPSHTTRLPSGWWPWLKRLQMRTGGPPCVVSQMFIHLSCLHPINFSCFCFVNRMLIVYYWETYVQRKCKIVILAGLLSIIKSALTESISTCIYPQFVPICIYLYV